MTPEESACPRARRARVAPGSAAPGHLGVFDGERRGTAPFAARGQPLDDAEQDEDDRSGDADGRIGGDEADERGRHTHRHKRDDEDETAPEPVTEVPGEERAEGPEEERDADRREGEHLGARLAGGREVELGEDEAAAVEYVK